LECRGVHGHQAVETVARRVDALATELKLEARDAEQCPGGSADLGREIRQRGDVVPGPRRLRRELLAGELHAVAGVAGEADDGSIQFLTTLPDTRYGRRRLAHRCSFRVRHSRGPAYPSRFSIISPLGSSPERDSPRTAGRSPRGPGERFYASGPAPEGQDLLGG